MGCLVWDFFFFLAKLLPEEYRTMSGSAIFPSDLGTELAAIEQREQRKMLGDTVTQHFMGSSPLHLPLTGPERAKEEAMTAISPHPFLMPTVQFPQCTFSGPQYPAPLNQSLIVHLCTPFQARGPIDKKVWMCRNPLKKGLFLSSAQGK